MNFLLASLVIILIAVAIIEMTDVYKISTGLKSRN